MKLYCATALLSFAALGQAQAVQLPIFGNFSPESFDFQTDRAAFDFRGIVGLSNCSGSIVRFDDSKDTDRAMVMSNGHCVELIKPGTVVVDRPVRKSFTVLGQDAQKLGTVSADKIIYATMTKTDVSLFLLTETYQQIHSKFSVEALTLSREIPAVGTSIEIISGYWKRGYSCQIETFVKTLKEGDWSWTNSLRYSRPGCETIGGTSGSPVVAAGTRTAIAVNNTGNESGRMCEVNNPCEISDDGTPFAQKGYSYGQQTYWFYTCRNEAGVFDLNQKDCMLPK